MKKCSASQTPSKRIAAKSKKKQPAAVLPDPPTAAGIKKSRLAVLQRGQKIVPAVPHLAPLSAAIEHAEQLVGEAQVLARQFNLAEGHTLVFNEDFNLSFGNPKAQWWQEFLTASAVRPHGQTTPEPGVRIQLFPDVQMRDSPRRCSVAVPRVKAARTEAARCAHRV